MIYKIENEIVKKFENITQMSSYYSNLPDATSEQINEYLLNQVKQEKLAELDKYYQSNECWTYQIVNGKNSLTKTADWFSSMIPPCLGKKIFLESDSGLIEYSLPRDVGEDLLYQIKIISSLEIKKLYNELKVKIQEAKNKEELEKLNIKSFLGKTPRVMKI